MAGRKLGVLGGTFDPIHLGHLAAAEAARSAYGLDGVVFVPAARPPHKQGGVQATALQRYLMVVLATADNPAFAVSRMELDRPGPSYTVDTLRSLRARHPGDSLWFISGADSICGLTSWFRHEQLLDLAEFVAVSRTGFPRERVAAFAGSLAERHRSRVHYLDTFLLDIASHELRRQVAAGQSIRYLVPAAVAAFIDSEGLYRDAPPELASGAAAGGCGDADRPAGGAGRAEEAAARERGAGRAAASPGPGAPGAASTPDAGRPGSGPAPADPGRCGP